MSIASGDGYVRCHLGSRVLKEFEAQEEKVGISLKMPQWKMAPSSIEWRTWLFYEVVVGNLG